MAKTQIQTTLRGRALGLSASGALVLNLPDNTQVVISASGLSFTNAAGVTTLIGGAGGATVAYAGTALTLDSSNTATYNGNIIATSNASPVTITVNTGAALTAGFSVIQKGAGIVTLAGSATLTSPNGLATSGLDTPLTVIPTATDAYDVFADPTADKTLVNATAGATPAVDMAKYNVVDLTLTANATPAFSGSVSGRAYSVTLILRQGGAGSFTVSWPSTTWLSSAGSGTAPTLPTAVGSFALVTMTTVDGGATYIGSNGGRS